MSDIQWTDETWNPVTGCTKVSAGCKNCYAERLAPRVFASQAIITERHENGNPKTTRPRRFTDVRTQPHRLDQPLRWRKPRRVFVNSMSDLFHEDVPDEFIDQVFAVMALSPRHTFQVLTKRPKRMRRYMTEVIQRPDVPTTSGHASFDREECVRIALTAHHAPKGKFAARIPWPLPNVHLGVSCEDQATADERIPILLVTPAAVRFVSLEPLLGPIDLRYLQPNDPPTEINAVDGTHGVLRPHGGKCDALDWVITGGESGPNARPCDVGWIRSIVEQCRAASVPCFVKQLGAEPFERAECRADEPQGTDAALARLGEPPSRRERAMAATGWTHMALPDGTSHYYRNWSLRDRKGGDPTEWPEDLRVREFPNQESPA